MQVETLLKQPLALMNLQCSFFLNFVPSVHLFHQNRVTKSYTCSGGLGCMCIIQLIEMCTTGIKYQVNYFRVLSFVISAFESYYLYWYYMNTLIHFDMYIKPFIYYLPYMLLLLMCIVISFTSCVTGALFIVCLEIMFK